MERTLKKSQAALLTPGPTGWRLNNGATAPATFATLADAAAALPAHTTLHLALPAGNVVFERLRLPSTDTAELAPMARLQLEKSLPFPPDEITCAIDLIDRSDSGATVLAMAVHNPQIDTLCEPLRQKALLPDCISVFATHVAAACPKNANAFVVYRENGRLVLAIAEHAHLTFCQTTTAETGEDLAAELTAFLLSAELAGVATTLSSVLLDTECAGLQDTLTGLFNLPVTTFSTADKLSGPAINLVPSHWRLERERMQRRARLKSRLLGAAIAYALVVATAVGWIAWLNVRANQLRRQIAIAQPEVDAVQSRKSRWLALAPALDPQRYTIEILHQAFVSLPSPDIRLTQFDQNPRQFMIEGEAPSANLAIEYGERLKKNEALADFRIEMGPPAILPNDHAQFRVFGKL